MEIGTLPPIGGPPDVVVSVLWVVISLAKIGLVLGSVEMLLIVTGVVLVVVVVAAVVVDSVVVVFVSSVVVTFVTVVS